MGFVQHKPHPAEMDFESLGLADKDADYLEMLGSQIEDELHIRTTSLKDLCKQLPEPIRDEVWHLYAIVAHNIEDLLRAAGCESVSCDWDDEDHLLWFFAVNTPEEADLLETLLVGCGQELEKCGHGDQWIGYCVDATQLIGIYYQLHTRHNNQQATQEAH